MTIVPPVPSPLYNTMSDKDKMCVTIAGSYQAIQQPALCSLPPPSPTKLTQISVVHQEIGVQPLISVQNLQRLSCFFYGIQVVKMAFSMALWT
eukprot:8969506-Ditylum_brightwellii.AAC.1